MRLIDADALKKDLTRFYDNEVTAKRLIDEQPTIEPERKKGQWIIKDNPGTGWYRVTCSECGEDVTSTIPVIGFFPDAKPIWNFCQDCGADMRGE